MTTSPAPAKRRDANRTRLLLLEAARRRFAKDGYAATTVREIADDAGVNVALISRYFNSKEGLFEACLTSAVHEMRRTTEGEAPLSSVPRTIAKQVSGIDSDGIPRALVLLLRSSGDERADEIRIGMLRTFAEKLAGAAGWGPGNDDDQLLRAQVAISAALGIALLRSTTRLEPLASATEDDLVGPLTDLIESLLKTRRACAT